ncbi:hypothetical protein D3C76_283780 [compost metagenome]
MARIENRRQGMVTIVSSSGKDSGTIELMHGINENVPDWVTKEQFFKDMQKAGFLAKLAKEEEPAEALYKLDANGMPIQALDDDGEPLFDEKTGDPIFLPADEE